MIPTPIVALDVPTADDALRLLDRLDDRCSFYKIGSELFTAEGPDIVRRIIARKREVFLDLKYHDIPNTVAGAVRRAAHLGVKLVTVHASGGRAMMKSAVDAAANESDGACGILGVTVLTSLDDAQLADAWGRDRGIDTRTEVLRLADLVAETGALGVVCSGLEVSAIRERFGDSLAALVPGIRLPSDAAHDQSRIVTPRDAMALGATYIVLGRTVTAAAQPAAAMQRVLDELRVSS
jgi:orotidine-5'-phosphate decarboxylase